MLAENYRYQTSENLHFIWGQTAGRLYALLYAPATEDKFSSVPDVRQADVDCKFSMYPNQQQEI